MSDDKHFHQAGRGCCPHPDCVKATTVHPRDAVTAPLKTAAEAMREAAARVAERRGENHTGACPCCRKRGHCYACTEDRAIAAEIRALPVAEDPERAALEAVARAARDVRDGDTLEGQRFNEERLDAALGLLRAARTQAEQAGSKLREVRRG